MINTSTFAIATLPTPVLNTSDFSACFGGKSGDEVSLKHMETVLLPGTKIELLEQVAKSHIWKIKTSEYSKENIFIDDRFVTSHESCVEREKELRPIPEILKKMSESIGTPYVWGGNWPQGIELLSQLYPSQTEFSQLDPKIQNGRQLKGVDCSGLLYYATNGFTPRNTSDLLTFGNAVDIQNKDANAICNQLQNLDLIVWKGHVVIVYSAEESIESLGPNKEINVSGVVKFNLIQRIQYIMKTMTPVNVSGSTEQPHFVVRRWHPDNIV
jgi:hypothetical protein